MFRRNVLLPCSGSRSNLSRQKQEESKLAALCCRHSLSDTEDGGNTFLRKVGKLLPVYTASHFRR
jgi:hypothetical protein